MPTSNDRIALHLMGPDDQPPAGQGGTPRAAADLPRLLRGRVSTLDDRIRQLRQLAADSPDVRGRHVNLGILDVLLELNAVVSALITTLLDEGILK
jgi:hypothetical protein